MGSLDIYEECDYCDGCGWHEGGKTLRTTCDDCKGYGALIRDGGKLRAMTDAEVEQLKLLIAPRALLPAPTATKETGNG